MSRISLAKCKKGDILISRHGKAFVFSHKDNSRPYPYIIKDFVTGDECTRLVNGHVFKKNRHLEDHDIISIMSINGFLLARQDKTVLINGMEYRDLDHDTQVEFNSLIEIIRVKMVASPVENS